MRRLQFLLLATAQLTGARQAGFSIHDDLVAYPQYEVVFSESFISQKEADALLSRANPHPTYAAEFSSQSDLAQQVQEAEADKGPKSNHVQETYELMHMAPSTYLCSIPILEPAGPENKTANDLAKQEEARELARASAAGWNLINELDGTCLYYMSGWWSYRFCYNREILQFHALPLMPNGEPPLRDPNTLEFVLGRGPKDADEPAGHGSTNEKAAAATTTDLQVKGDQRYLVQRLDRGTICDLTGRERTIEIQYHCMPGLKSDRIGWIKEVTTCAYLMVVNTPRLCNDVAFLPPKQTSANPISCRLILDTSDPEASAAWHRRKTLEAEAAMVRGERRGGGGGGDARFAENARPDLDAASFRQQEEPVTVGGVLVGGRKVLSEADEEGKPPAVLKPPHNFLPNKAQAGKPKAPAAAVAPAAADEAEAYETETIASRKHKAEGGELWILSDEELEELELNPETVEDMRQEIEKLAGDKGWKLEVVEAPGEARELRGYVDDDEDDAKAKARAKAKAAGQKGPDADEEDGVGSEEQFYGDW
ncbi:Protein OS-9 like protein [Verticillium longisporum]|nr:Protein OS-9 like protein [Verticillium longisporum]